MASFSSLFESRTTLAKGIVAEALQKARDNRKESLLKIAVEIVGHVDRIQSSFVAILRDMRRQEKTHKERLEKMNRAAEYFENTGNFAPLMEFCPHLAAYCSALGVDMPTENEKKIPANWKP